MLTLIKREIEDNYVFFIGVVILATIFSMTVFWHRYYGERYDDSLIVIGFVLSIVVMLGFCSMGAAQMYLDKTKKVSALLATLAVTRNQIFTARVVAGLLLVLIGFIPIAELIIAVCSALGTSFYHIHSGFYYEVLIPVFILGFACYCVGLQAGWASGKVRPTLGVLGIGIFLIPIILIKGFGWEIYAILVLFIAACLVRAWRTFSSAAF
ncbi:MAG: hypothetical protein ABSH16_10125 [Sedimentisphaerales bacterium]